MVNQCCWLMWNMVVEMMLLSVQMRYVSFFLFDVSHSPVIVMAFRVASSSGDVACRCCAMGYVSRVYVVANRSSVLVCCGVVLVMVVSFCFFCPPNCHLYHP